MRIQNLVTLFVLLCELRKNLNVTEKTIVLEIYKTNSELFLRWLPWTMFPVIKNDFLDINYVFVHQMLGKPVSAPKEITELMEYTDEMCIKFSTNLDGMLTYGEMENLLNSTQSKKWEFHNNKNKRAVQDPCQISP